MALTRRYNFRKTVTGKIVLQVEEAVPSFWSWMGESSLRKRWRDATVMDLTAAELRSLMDGRFTPYFSVPCLGVRQVITAAGSNVVPFQSLTSPADAPLPRAEIMEAM